MSKFKHVETGHIKDVPDDHPVHDRMVESPRWDRLGRGKPKRAAPVDEPVAEPVAD